VDEEVGRFLVVLVSVMGMMEVGETFVSMLIGAGLGVIFC
jgi:hypothetical protein